ncbi:MAG: hypothetical protein ACOH14_04935 [Rhodoglobus sp.]
MAANATVSATVPMAPAICSERTTPAECDADRDRIPDALEQQICGTATCATGREDRDKDGISDWVEFRACGSAACADTAADVDADGIPDFAELLTCGSPTCSTGREDADSDKVADWVEFVICGDRTCANGSEDYDADGISDAKQLAACVIAFDVITPARWAQNSTPVTLLLGRSGIIFELVWWPIWVGAGLSLVGLLLLGLALWAQRRRDAHRDAASDAAPQSPDDDSFTKLLGVDA